MATREDSVSQSKEEIEKQLKSINIKRDFDVRELYLANRNLTRIEDLSRFKNLKQLWLNSNSLRRINCLRANYRLSELYLQNNQLVEVKGALQHLSSLEVLMLHKNQLVNLENVVKEFKKMQNLRVLNLFDNPVAQEPEYRLYVIHHVPTVELLDRQEVLKAERDHGQKLYESHNEEVKETVAFGRRSEGPPYLYYPAGRDMLKITVPAEHEVGNNFYRDNPPCESDEQAIALRAMKRATMQKSYFNWSRVPRAEERRLAVEPFSTPQVVTVIFK